MNVLKKNNMGSELILNDHYFQSLIIGEKSSVRYVTYQDEEEDQ